MVVAVAVRCNIKVMGGFWRGRFGSDFAEMVRRATTLYVGVTPF